MNFTTGIRDRARGINDCLVAAQDRERKDWDLGGCVLILDLEKKNGSRF